MIGVAGGGGVNVVGGGKKQKFASSCAKTQLIDWAELRVIAHDRKMCLEV